MLFSWLSINFYDSWRNLFHSSFSIYYGSIMSWLFSIRYLHPLVIYSFTSHYYSIRYNIFHPDDLSRIIRSILLHPHDLLITHVSSCTLDPMYLIDRCVVITLSITITLLILDHSLDHSSMLIFSSILIHQSLLLDTI